MTQDKSLLSGTTRHRGSERGRGMVETPFGACGHTHYEGGPPCVHSAYLRGLDDGLTVGWRRGYEAAEAAAELVREAQETGLYDEPGPVWAFKEMRAAGVEVRADNLPPTRWHPEAAPGELDDLYSGVKPSAAERS